MKDFNNKDVKEFLDGILYTYEIKVEKIRSVVTDAAKSYVETSDNPSYDEFIEKTFAEEESPVSYGNIELSINRSDEWKLARPFIDDWMDLSFEEEWQDKIDELVYDCYTDAAQKDVFAEEVERGEHDPKTL